MNASHLKPTSRENGLIDALDRARHELVALDGLEAADGAAPAETWTIDTRNVLRAIDDATAPFENDNDP